MNLENLFNKAKAGDEEAEKELFSKLLVRFKLIAYHILRNKEAAEDAAHDAIVNVLRTYRELEVHTSFIAWAQTIIRRQALKYIEKRKREQRINQEIGQGMNPERHYISSPLLERQILNCLRKLSAKDKRYARVLNLKHLGFAYEEICERLGTNHNNVYVLLHRARKALADCLDKGEGK